MKNDYSVKAASTRISGEKTPENPGELIVDLSAAALVERNLSGSEPCGVSSEGHSAVAEPGGAVRVNSAKGWRKVYK